MGKKLVSLVPSWTETLLRAGEEVVGRTRYCIHPAPLAERIPVLGGTKAVNWSKLEDTPDLVVFDREENKKEMAESCPFPYWASHIRHVDDLPQQTEDLALRIQSEELMAYSKRWKRISEAPSLKQRLGPNNLEFPGLIRWFVEPREEITEIVYFVWRKPWMIIQPETFIGSMLTKLGFSVLRYPSDKLYPEVDLELLLNRPGVCFFFSSEPYPFENRLEELRGFQPPCALVDGEAFGWFGLRSLEFLESAFSGVTA